MADKRPAKAASVPAARPALSSRAWPYALAPVGAAIAVHLATTSHGFIWDDPLVLDQIRHIRGLGDIVVPPESIPHFYYRPLIFVTFLIDRALGGEAPFWFHLTVVLWHGLTTGLVFLIARQLLGEVHSLEAGCAALLFAVHPVHVESVAWIAGRSDVVATAFVLAALLFSAHRERPWTAVAAGACVLAGLLAKEVALAAVLLLPARDLLVDRRLIWQRYLPIALALGSYFSLRHFGLGSVVTGSPTSIESAELGRSLLAALGWYAAKLTLPWSLEPYVPQVPMTEAYELAGFGAVLFAGVSFAWAVVTRRGVLAFLLLWLAATIAPSLFVIVRRSASAVLAERYLYLPSVAAVLLVGWAIARVGAPALRRALAGGCAVLAVVAAWSSASRSRVWADDLAFWSHVAHNVPDDAMPRRELAAALLKRDRFDDAQRQLEAALALPGPIEERVMTYNNLGNLLVRREELDAAATAFQSGVDLRPHAHLFNGLGRVAMKRAERAQREGNGRETMRQIALARQFLERAVELDARDHKSHALLGQVLFNLNERDAARHHLETALAIEPQGPIADSAQRFLQKMQ